MIKKFRGCLLVLSFFLHSSLPSFSMDDSDVFNTTFSTTVLAGKAEKRPPLAEDCQENPRKISKKSKGDVTEQHKQEKEQIIEELEEVVIPVKKPSRRVVKKQLASLSKHKKNGLGIMMSIGEHSSLFEGIIRRNPETKLLEQVIISEVDTRDFRHIRARTANEIIIRCEEGREPGPWIHDKSTLQSTQTWYVTAKRDIQERRINETILETKPFIPKSKTLRKVGGPMMENGVPAQHQFQVIQEYELGDNSTWSERIDNIVLHLCLTHQGFFHNRNNNTSYQLIDGYADYEGQHYEGVKDYRLASRPYQHFRMLESRPFEFTKVFKVSIDPQEAIRPEQITEEHKLVSRETFVHDPNKLSHWRYDDSQLKAYRVYYKEGTLENEVSEEWINYPAPTIFIRPIGNFLISNGIPTTQTCDITFAHVRPVPDNTVYSRTIRQDLPLERGHVGFRHDNRANKSYQRISLTAVYNLENSLLISPSYEIKSRAFNHLEENLGWNDNIDSHTSSRFARIYIDTSEALRAEEIEPEVIIEARREVEMERHIMIALSKFTKWLPGPNYRIPHSEWEY